MRASSPSEMPLGGTGLRIKTNERKRFESGNQTPGRQVLAMPLKFLPTSADKGSSLCDTSIDCLTLAVLIEKLLIPPIVHVARKRSGLRCNAYAGRWCDSDRGSRHAGFLKSQMGASDASISHTG